MRKTFFMFAAASLIGFTACEKENEIELPKQKENTGNETANPTIKSINGTLYFETAEDFNATLKKVRKMTKEERIVWELSHNFKSFGTLSEFFYENIDFNQFNNFEEIKAFVEQHNNYLEFITDETGEISCNVQEEANPERYLMDANKMYFIGSEVYKQIDGMLIASPINQTANLKVATSTKNSSLPNTRIAAKTEHKIESVSPIKTISPTTKNESLEHKGADVNKTRIVLSIETKFHNKASGKQRSYGYSVKNQKKTLGVWIRGPRTTTYHIDFATYDPVLSDYEEKRPGIHKDVRETKFALDSDDYTDDVHMYSTGAEFLYADCWATNWSGCSAQIKL